MKSISTIKLNKRSHRIFMIMIAIFLSICMVMGLSACGGEEEQSQKTSTKQSNKQSASQSDPEVNSQPDPPQPEAPPEKTLVVTSPAAADVTTTQSSYAIAGSCDPEQPVYLNGEALTIAENGSFAVDVKLNEGANTFTLEHKGVKLTYTIRYRYIVIESELVQKRDSSENVI